MPTGKIRDRYKAGSKTKMLRTMARLAIRDQEALIAAYTPRFGTPDEVAIDAISGAKANIEDFKKFIKTLPVSN